MSDTDPRLKRLEQASAQSPLFRLTDAPDTRVPAVSALKLLSQTKSGAVTTIVLGWLAPDSYSVDRYELWLSRSDLRQPALVASVRDSPVSFQFSAPSTTTCVVYVRTVMRSGLSSSPNSFPTVAFVTT